jgi:PAT family acetyl-CoA transporter-like MFS transporter 1
MSLSPLHTPLPIISDSNHPRDIDNTPQADLELLPLFNSGAEDSDSSIDDGTAAANRRMSRSRRGQNMNSSSSVEFRRKPGHALEGESTSSQTAALLDRESFSLDEGHHGDKPAANSLMELSPKDRRNFFLLVLLYFLQGVPMGLAMGSVPFLLKNKLSYGEIGVFTLASYPYSMKLLWSPIVDAIWSPQLGRRKSWIVPIQALSAVMMLWLGGRVEQLMEEASQKLYLFTFVFFMLVMLCATQDVAVDGMFYILSFFLSRWLGPRGFARCIGIRNFSTIQCEGVFFLLIN